MTYNLYADVIFFNNLIMDFFLLLILRRAMRLEKRKYGIPLASVLGASYALTVSIFPFSLAFFQMLVTYGVVSGVMVWVAFRFRKRAEVLKAVAGLYLTAVIMAGLFYLFDLKGLSFGVYALAAAGCYFLACFLWETVKTTANINGHLFSVIVFYKGKSQSIIGFMDTGNRLREPYSRQPVNVISADCCGELFQTVSSVLYIPYRSVGKKGGVLPAVKADRMEIEKDGKKVVVEEPYIAISKEPLSPDGSYHMLLNEKLWL